MLSAVEADSNIIIGASIIKEMGKTMPPKAARLILGSANRARTALIMGTAVPIISQLAANGHHIEKTVATGTSFG